MPPKKKSLDPRGYSTCSVPKTKIFEPQPAPVVSIPQETAEPIEKKVNVNSIAVSSELQDERVTIFRVDAEHVKEEKKRSEIVSNTKLPIFTLPERTERSLLELIKLDSNYFLESEWEQETSISKLNFVYLSLLKCKIYVDFIEKALWETCSQSLSSVFDWLCINVASENLPDSLVETASVQDQDLCLIVPEIIKNLPERPASSNQSVNILQRKKQKDDGPPIDIKNWILSKYSLKVQDTSEQDLPTNTQHAKLKLEFDRLKKTLALEEIGAQRSAIRDEMNRLKNEMDIVSAARDFNPRISNEEFKKMVIIEETSNKKERKPKVVVEESDNEYGEQYDIFAENSDTKYSVTQLTRRPNVLNLSFTKEQWSGKTPKQYCIDWLAKNAKGTKATFQQLEKNDFEFRCRVKLTGGPQKFDKVAVEMSPNELVTTAKDAEHYVATKLLFTLLPHLPIYRSLPPMYRDVWMHLEAMMKNAPKNDGGKSRRTEFVTKLAVERERRVKIISEKIEENAKAETIIKHKNVNYDFRTPKTSFEKLCEIFLKRLGHPDYLKFLDENDRKKLPVYEKRNYILDIIDQNQVVIISGETGSGKTTQIPQFILEDALMHKKQQRNIVCTQPRRISAVSIASRVSQEIGDGKSNAGGNNSLVGYQIRLESKTSESNRLTFCTTGVLLKRLETDSALIGVTHLVIDEVHERTVDSDILLLLVKKILTKRLDLKVILMSATAQSSLFQEYFSGSTYQSVPCVSIQGRTFPVSDYFLEDAIEHSGYIVEPNSEYSQSKARSGKKTGKFQLNCAFDEDSAVGEGATIDYAASYSPATLSTLRTMNIYKINYELIKDLILYLSRSQKSINGSMLVFLPGFEEIKRLNELLSTSKREFKQKIEILFLHSSIDSDTQIEVFEPAAPGAIKIVLSTNIAETGVTIPDVVYVIDTCRAKEICFDDRRHVKRLREVFVSKASCMQRRGRAGRIQKGICYHLIPQVAFNDLPSHQIPEISRIPLEEVCLRLSVLGFELNVSKTLEMAITPPPARNIERSIDYLKDVDALDENGKITPFGMKLSQLPVDVRVGRLLLFGVALQCLEPIATIAAMISLGKSPFLRPIGKEMEADNARLKFFYYDSDLMTNLNAYQQWKDYKHSKIDFCNKNYLSHSNMNNIENIKDQYIRTILASGLGAGYTINRGSAKPEIISTALGCGLYPNIVFIKMDDAVKKPVLNSISFSETVQLHPSSNLCDRLTSNSCNWYAYYEMMRTETATGNSTLSIMDLTKIDIVRVLLCLGAQLSSIHRRKALYFDRLDYTVQCMGRTGSVIRMIGEMSRRVVESRLGLSKLLCDEEQDVFEEESETLMDTIFESLM